MAIPNPPDLVDTIETRTNAFSDGVLLCVNARRMTLLATAGDTRNAKVERLRRRLEGLEQLEETKGEIESVTKENIIQETQENLLREVERKLEEVTTPLLEEVPAVPNYEALRPIVAVGKRGKAPGELWNPNAVAIDTNTNYIYVTEGPVFDNFSRISIFSDGGEFLNSYTHEHMKCPYGLAIHTNNMYITDIGVHAVFQCKIESDIRLVAKIGTKGTGNGEFNWPSNLAVSTNGDVYVADYNNKIQVLDSSLHYIRTLTEQSIQYPLDIKLTADSVYLLCDVSPCIRVFSYTGDMLRSLITRGDHLQVNNAMYFCLDSQENIIISDDDAHNIKVFTREGTLIQSIGGRGQEVGMFDYPKGLTLINQLNLVVLSGNANHRLQIFSSF